MAAAAPIAGGGSNEWGAGPVDWVGAVALAVALALEEEGAGATVLSMNGAAELFPEGSAVEALVANFTRISSARVASTSFCRLWMTRLSRVLAGEGAGEGGGSEGVCVVNVERRLDEATLHSINKKGM